MDDYIIALPVPASTTLVPRHRPTPEEQKLRACAKQKRYMSTPAGREKANSRNRLRYQTDAEYRQRVQLRNSFGKRTTKEHVYTVTDRDWRKLCLRYDNHCAVCGSSSTLTIDHVIPLSRGGRHSIGNLLPLCQSCNSSKKAMFLVEWLAQT